MKVEEKVVVDFIVVNFTTISTYKTPSITTSTATTTITIILTALLAFPKILSVFKI